MLKFTPSTELHSKKSVGVGSCFGPTSHGNSFSSLSCTMTRDSFFHSWFVPVLVDVFAMSGDLQ